VSVGDQVEGQRFERPERRAVSTRVLGKERRSDGDE
jgi:hypothetical protein